jgi:hypothetical protein
LGAINDKITLENTYLTINKEETQFLLSNRELGGKNETLNATIIKDAAAFFGAKYKSLMIEALEIQKRVVKLREEYNDIRSQIGSYSSKKEFSTGEVLIKIKTNSNKNVTLELVYNVSNAGWFPTYDIRVKNINNPLNIVYKANVKQNTKVDWTDIKIRFSSSDPSISSEAPELKTYFLDYNSRPPVYSKNIKTVSGIVSDGSGSLPGVSVLIDGTTIGTETNYDGHYSITIPKNAATLTFSYLGYKTVKRNIYSSNMNIQMEEDSNVLDEVVVTGVGIRRDNESLSYSQKSIREDLAKRKSENKYSIPTDQIVNQTTVNFEITAPYSLKSDNKSYTIGMKTYEVNADYQYYSVPKIDKNAFLIASASDWEKLNLLEGEANIYFEGTYIGKSLIDVRFETDKLKISLGRDKNVIINREKTKDFTTQQFIGSKKQENIGWAISVKNNKTEKINISIFDQIPVSTLEDIKVELDKITTGKLDAETGEILWKFELNSNTSKNLPLRYSVKYPKSETIILE